MQTKKGVGVLTRIMLMFAATGAVLFQTSCSLTDLLSALGLSSILESLTSGT